MKRSDVKSHETFREYISKKNHLIHIEFVLFFLLNIIILYVSFKLLIEFILEIYLIIGIVGTSLVGYSTVQSGETIIEFCSTKWDYNLDKAESLLNSKLYTGVGTIFLLTALLVGYYINYSSLT